MDLTKALNIIKLFEGCVLHAYHDGAGIPTIGWGHTAGVHMGQTCTQAQADKWLKEDLQKAIAPLSTLLKVKLNDNQFCAMASFCFNVGTGNLAKSHLLTYLNAGKFQEAAQDLLAYVHDVKGHIEPGLVRRRKAEMDLFLGLS